MLSETLNAVKHVVLGGSRDDLLARRRALLAAAPAPAPSPREQRRAEERAGEVERWRRFAEDEAARIAIDRELAACRPRALAEFELWLFRKFDEFRVSHHPTDGLRAPIPSVEVERSASWSGRPLAARSCAAWRARTAAAFRAAWSAVNSELPYLPSAELESAIAARKAALQQLLDTPTYEPIDVSLLWLIGTPRRLSSREDTPSTW